MELARFYIDLGISTNSSRKNVSVDSIVDKYRTVCAIPLHGACRINVVCVYVRRPAHKNAPK